MLPTAAILCSQVRRLLGASDERPMPEDGLQWANRCGRRVLDNLLYRPALPRANRSRTKISFDTDHAAFGGKSPGPAGAGTQRGLMKTVSCNEGPCASTQALRDVIPARNHAEGNTAESFRREWQARRMVSVRAPQYGEREGYAGGGGYGGYRRL